MNLWEFKKNFEKRRYNLLNTLQNGKEDIDLSRQHQIYGAIKELENTLRTIDYFQEQTVKNNFDIKLSKESKKTVLQRITKLKLKK
jgi:hypothetical protein|tara:strand:- start:184 stop:441 length:258 start_codon:yes stop_codon:yes gene_type:complete